jgi:large subunit ribosomal protein L21
MFAVIKTGGKQYVVKEGDVLSVEKLEAEAGRKFVFDRVLLIDEGEQTLVGTPVLENAAVLAEILKNYKDKKVLVFKKKRRKQSRRTRGHRQDLTEVKIEKIFSDKSALPAEAVAVEAAVREAAPAVPVEAAPEPSVRPAPAAAPREKKVRERKAPKKAAPAKARVAAKPGKKAKPAERRLPKVKKASK